MNHDGLTKALLLTTKSYRLGMEAEASENLVTVIDSILTNLNNAATTPSTHLNNVLAEILAAQGRRDFLRIADLLEYELAPVLVS